MSVEELCRRQMRLRIAAIANAIGNREERMRSVAGSLSDSARIERDITRRMLRVAPPQTTER